MEVIVGRTAGFCGGITNAIKNTDKELEKLKKNQKAYCLGELAHNKQVMDKLEKKGLVVIYNIEDEKIPKDSSLIVRAHGISKDIYILAKNKGINLIDLTCPKVLKIHNIAEEYESKNYYIFLVGEKKHPEVIGTISFCGDSSDIIETEEDIQRAIKRLEECRKEKLLIIAQTTFNLEKFEYYVEIIKKKAYNKNIQIEVINTICDATRLRQEETEKISKQVECMIIIGGKHSSNTKKLYDISKNNCKYAVHIETKGELDIKEIEKHEKIGIMAGASTPKESIEDVIKLF